MSAAGSVILALALVIMGIIGLPIGGFFAWQALRDRQERRKLERAVQQAQVYAALQGAQRPPAVRRVGPQQQTPPVIIVSGQAPQNGAPWEVV